MKIFKIVFLFVIAVLLVLVFIYFSNIGQISLANHTNKLKIAKTEKIETDINSIDILWESGEVKIFKTDKNSINIVQKTPSNLKKERQFSINVDKDRLVIKDNNKNGIFKWFQKGSVLEVYIPDKKYNIFNVKCYIGVIESDFLRAEKFTGELTTGIMKLNGDFYDANINTKSGSIKSENLLCHNLKISTTSGKIELKGDFKNLNLHVTSGNAQIHSNTVLNKFFCNIASGSAVLVLPENQGVTLNSSVQSGSISNDFGDYSSRNNTKEPFNTSVQSGDGQAVFSVLITSGTLAIEKDAGFR